MWLMLILTCRVNIQHQLITYLLAVDLGAVLEKIRQKKDPKDRTEQIEKENLEIQAKYAQSVTDMRNDEYDKRIAALNDSFVKEKNALMNKFHNDLDITDESKGLILDTIENWEYKLSRDIDQINLQRQQSELKTIEETLDLKLAALQEGSEEELDLRLQLIETQRQQALLANIQAAHDERKSEADINAKYDRLALTEAQSFTYDRSMLMLDRQQELDSSEFELIRRSEEEKD